MATDITYTPTGEGWLYLAGHKGLFSDDLVGYAMSERITKNLVSQYCVHEYQKLLDQFGMVASMSRRGNCDDNATMESFWTAQKRTGASPALQNRVEGIQAISEYIRIFYRQQRKQVRLVYLSPAAFERQFYEKRLAA